MLLNERLKMLTLAEKAQLKVAFEAGLTQIIKRDDWFVGVNIFNREKFKIGEIINGWSTGNY